MLLCLQLTKGEAAKPQDKAQAPPLRIHNLLKEASSRNMVNKQQESAEVRGEDDSRGPPRQRMEI